MIRSMTGYGQAQKQILGYQIEIGAKSVNHRYLEVNIRLPREWMQLENEMAKSVQNVLKRGKVDVFVSIERTAEAAGSLDVNWALAEDYMRAGERLKERFGLADSLTLRDLLQLPDVIRRKEEDTAETQELIGRQILECLDEVLSDLVKMRAAEGAHLYSDIDSRLSILENDREQIVRWSTEVAEDYRRKLHQRIQEIAGDVAIDEQRLAMEVALFADRSNIDEETARLQSHFAQFRTLLTETGPVGRKLDFLIQEMNREMNTVGSKAHHAAIINAVVHMKAELEKIREQIQNIE